MRLAANVAKLINKIFSSQVKELFDRNGVPSVSWSGRNVSDLTKYTENGMPVVVRIENGVGPDKFSHFVVVDGVTIRNGVKVVAIRDPQGVQYFSPINTFEKYFTGDVIVPKGWQNGIKN